MFFWYRNTQYSIFSYKKYTLESINEFERDELYEFTNQKHVISRVDWKLTFSNYTFTRSIFLFVFLCTVCVSYIIMLLTFRSSHLNIYMHLCVLKLVFIIIGLFYVCVTALWIVSKIKRYINKRRLSHVKNHCCYRTILRNFYCVVDYINTHVVPKKYRFTIFWKFWSMLFTITKKNRE